MNNLDDLVTLSDGQVKPLKDAVDATIAEVLTTLISVEGGPVKKAMLCLMNHMSANWRATYILDEHREPYERELLSHSLAIISRSIFDASLQLAYIAEQDTEARANLYVNFEAVELFTRAQKVVKQNDGMSKAIAGSPLRANGEQRLQARYQAVEKAYTGKTGKVRSVWYSHSNLGNMAKDLDMYDEYFWYTQRFNSSVHAGPHAAMKGNPVDQFLTYAAVLMMRAVQVVVRCHRLAVSSMAQEMIDALSDQSLTSTN